MRTSELRLEDRAASRPATASHNVSTDSLGCDLSHPAWPQHWPVCLFADPNRAQRAGIATGRARGQNEIERGRSRSAESSCTVRFAALGARGHDAWAILTMRVVAVRSSISCLWNAQICRLYVATAKMQMGQQGAEDGRIRRLFAVGARRSLFALAFPHSGQRCIYRAAYALLSCPFQLQDFCLRPNDPNNDRNLLHLPRRC